MRLALGVTLALLLVAACIPAMAQGAFSDVPSDHWAYAAVQELAESGIVIGYPDGTYKGPRMMTRYEFAMAISRLLDQGLQGPKGEKGEVGPTGPAGPQGPAGTGGALTDRQKALLQQLENEFAPELKALRNDLDELTFRVDDLEARKVAGPKIGISGVIDYRTGLYGDNLRFRGGANGFPGVDFKDSVKANSFGTMETKICLSGQLNDNAAVNVVLMADTRGNSPWELNNNQGWAPGYMDTVRLDEAWVKVNTKFIAPMTLKIGKQYFFENEGLVIDNELFPMKAIDLGITAGNGISLRGIYGHLDEEAFSFYTVDYPWTDNNFGQDKYAGGVLSIPVAGWTITGDYLFGMYHQRAWSVGLDGKLFGHQIRGEFAQGLKDYDGYDIDDENNAWVVGANLVDSKNLTLGAKYGELEYNYYYASYLSALWPYAWLSPHYVDWADRPLFLDYDNIARGWEVNLEYRGLANGTMPIKVRYYDGDKLEPVAPKKGSSYYYTDGDAVWTVSIGKELAKDVTATLLYGQRETKHTTGEDTDPIQLLRGEVAVKF